MHPTPGKGKWRARPCAVEAFRSRCLGRGEHPQASGDEEPEGRKEDDQTCEAGDDRLHGIRTEDGDEGAEEGAAHRATERLTSHLGTEGEDEHDEDPWHESRRW